ncbi:hypothetical protein [Nocardia colli]|uniref:hypothetical protein n=1 Tax=Nocardia colli TaxID=2545717 RepID=UPI0035D608AD
MTATGGLARIESHSRCPHRWELRAGKSTACQYYAARLIEALDLHSKQQKFHDTRKTIVNILSLRFCVVAIGATFLVAGSLTGTTVEHPAIANAAPVAPIADELVQLQEFSTTSDYQGWYYTTELAERETPRDDSSSYTLWGNKCVLHTTWEQGRTAVFRVRSRADRPSYMLSISRDETLRPDFDDLHFLGYADGSQHSGQFKLLRFNNGHGAWRVMLESPDIYEVMKHDGYDFDGPIGWVGIAI